MPRLVTFICIVFGVLGCDSAGTGGNAPEGAQVAASSKSRLTLDQLGAAKVQELAAGNLKAAADLYVELGESHSNIFISPHSISTALAMAYAGARTNTAAQMKEVLHFELTEAELHPAFNALDQELASRGESAGGKDGKPFRLRVVNQAWGQNNFEFRTEYLDTLAVHYGSGLYLLDFVTQQEQSAHIINDWVREQTEDKIQDLIEPSLITPETRLVLTNAVYFNAAWAVPFEAADTASEDFTTLAGHTIQIPTMQQVAQLRYADTESWQAVELPYDGDELAMVIVLPKEGALGSIEGNLASVLDEAVAQLSDHLVTLSMPKFQFEFQQSLKEPLINLGMTDAFDGADFSGINESVPLKIQDVIHQSFVSVDEAGTEAAAATAVILGLRSAPESAEIHLNRPFIFAIRDNATGAIVFLGRLADPSALN